MMTAKTSFSFSIYEMVANRLVFISCHLSNLSDKGPTCLCLFSIEIM